MACDAGEILAKLDPSLSVYGLDLSALWGRTFAESCASNAGQTWRPVARTRRSGLIKHAAFSCRAWTFITKLGVLGLGLCPRLVWSLSSQSVNIG